MSSEQKIFQTNAVLSLSIHYFAGIVGCMGSNRKVQRVALGNALRDRRAQLGRSLTDVAKDAGVSVSTASRVELEDLEEYCVSATLRAYAAALGLRAELVLTPVAVP